MASKAASRAIAIPGGKQEAVSCSAGSSVVNSAASFENIMHSPTEVLCGSHNSKTGRKVSLDKGHVYPVPDPAKAVQAGGTPNETMDGLIDRLTNGDIPFVISADSTTRKVRAWTEGDLSVTSKQDLGGDAVLKVLQAAKLKVVSPAILFKTAGPFKGFIRADATMIYLDAIKLYVLHFNDTNVTTAIADSAESRKSLPARCLEALAKNEGEEYHRFHRHHRDADLKGLPTGPEGRDHLQDSAWYLTASGTLLHKIEEPVHEPVKSKGEDSDGGGHDGKGKKGGKKADKSADKPADKAGKAGKAKK
mmetsp:Transcript_21724/g.37023  ORF Transcript_21724/g.37023 Transcript_21724/m.37023 type:complete len:306 (+) Transcript_21724:102-1019(+)|eukprot:CAMPEP_0119109790 /NCGR_PEP_ID=MMETSP1180-20130426/23440_1 /TAXON_ID=3052 ORGANISM="Chlamydomonas cf sp, Strain CCMP681" /NCGR_SAMPLE_ID=MMETSP1180 /ASSEMBLY_ACC=CAM_ASM_000741 /LENGTH=305 /DNA_ID=CAMNT_0007095757 /DNA_START=83 /DNA_END=1000 /DNA_ORIENTATION=+